ncbi:Serine/threonine-protein kinase Nek9 [Blyttiomyces sp. JEL0837]|nr:Serine/threonine-protein kinase Nek9 [Blyttiomyces sp. JEL0837]
MARFNATLKILKLGDFGIARVMKSEHEQASTLIGTPNYLSPQVAQGEKYSWESDVWAVGYSFGLRNLISKLLSKDAQKRPTVPFLRSLFTGSHHNSGTRPTPSITPPTKDVPISSSSSSRSLSAMSMSSVQGRESNAPLLKYSDQMQVDGGGHVGRGLNLGLRQREEVIDGGFNGSPVLKDDVTVVKHDQNNLLHSSSSTTKGITNTSSKDSIHLHYKSTIPTSSPPPSSSSSSNSANLASNSSHKPSTTMTATKIERYRKNLEDMMGDEGLRIVYKELVSFGTHVSKNGINDNSNSDAAAVSALMMYLRDRKRLNNDGSFNGELSLKAAT